LALKGQTPEEQILIMQQLAITDFLVGDRQSTHVAQKLCQNLAASFLAFYDRCRLFGIDHETAGWRLFLVTITQKLAIMLAPTWCTNSIYL
jgi:arginyl-tRNA synthetase